MLTLHAAAAVAVFAIALRGRHCRLWGAAAVLMLLGASLFAGEIAFHTFTDNASFQFLAPIGGSGMILSWLVMAVAAFVTWARD
jgi:uncharacterized membrane protein YgdD (TMEM256/DUF423 family)